MEPKKALTFLLILCFAVVSIIEIEIVKADMLTCNEALDALSLGISNFQSFSFRETEGFEQAKHICERGITSILVWLAPNGTYYQIEYQSERILRKIGESYSSEWNPPDGYTFWWLINEDGEIYFVDAFDGSIIFHLSGRGNTPDEHITTNIILYVILPLVLVMAVATASVLMIKRKKVKKIKRIKI